MPKMEVPKTAAGCIEHLRGRITPDEFEVARWLIEAFAESCTLAALEQGSNALLQVMGRRRPRTPVL